MGYSKGLCPIELVSFVEWGEGNLSQTMGLILTNSYFCNRTGVSQKRTKSWFYKFDILKNIFAVAKFTQFSVMSDNNNGFIL